MQVGITCTLPTCPSKDKMLGEHLLTAWNFFHVLIVLPVFSLTSWATPDSSTIPGCEPYRCPGGGPNISYPFWHHEPGSDSYCGYSGLDLSCVNGTPAVTTATHTYFVEEIDHNYRTVTVVDADARKGWAASCPGISQNLTSEQVFPLYTSSADTNLTLFLDCKDPNGTIGLPPASPWDGCPGGGSWFVFPSDKVPPEHALALAGACKQAVVVAAFKEEVDAGNLTARLPDVLRKGFEMRWDISTLKNCKDCEESGGLCGYKNVSGPGVLGSDGLVFVCNCPYGESDSSCAKVKSSTKRRIVIIGSFGLLLTSCILGIVLCLCRRHWKMRDLEERAMIGGQTIDAILAPIALKRYKYSEVKSMTGYFAVKLGNGGYGSVFKGKLSSGILVAVKVLSDCNGSGEDFINEVATIGRTNHVNVVSLLGFCFEGSKRALIYEFMPNGSLEKFLFLDSSETMTTLGWDQLYKISLGIARGLEYLHKGCRTRIVHFDIKPHNILLDEDFTPKISDFGLAKLCPPKESILSMVCARGTIGYIAPEVFSRNFGTVSSKSDVYSYGMMILEMVGRRRNADPLVENCSEVYFPHWVYDHFEQDKDLEVYGITTETQDIAKKMIIVGLYCIQTSPTLRPTISRVVEMLDGNFADLHMPPKPYICSPPRSKADLSITSTSIYTMSIT